MRADQIAAFWRSYLETLPADSPERFEEYVAEGWGDSPEMADELGALIVGGTKTATCSALWKYEAEGAAYSGFQSRTSGVHAGEHRGNHGLHSARVSFLKRLILGRRL